MPEDEFDEEAFAADFDEAMREHHAEVEAYGGNREWLHRKVGMTYEEIDAWDAMIKRLVKECLAELHP